MMPSTVGFPDDKIENNEEGFQDVFDLKPKNPHGFTEFDPTKLDTTAATAADEPNRTPGQLDQILGTP